MTDRGSDIISGTINSPSFWKSYSKETIQLTADKRTIDVYPVTKYSIGIGWVLSEGNNTVLRIVREWKYTRWWGALRCVFEPEYSIRTPGDICVGGYKRRSKKTELIVHGEVLPVNREHESMELNVTGHGFTIMIKRNMMTEFCVSNASLLYPVMCLAFLERYYWFFRD